MEVDRPSSPIGEGDRGQRPSRKNKRDREEEIFQQAVGTEGQSRVDKRERSSIRRAPSGLFTVTEKSLSRRFLDLLHQQAIPELEHLASDPQMTRNVAMHLLQASGMERAGTNVLGHLLAAAGADSCRMARHLAKWGEASPEMFAVLILMGPEETQKAVAHEVMSCLGQRGGMPIVEALCQNLPPHVRPDLEEMRQQLLDLENLSRQLGGLNLGLPDRGKSLT